MKKFKRITATFLIITFSSVIFSGCQKEETFKGITAVGTLVGGFAGIFALFKEPETKIIQITTPQANSASAKDKSSETFADDRKALMAAADTLESQKNSVPVKDKSSETFADDRKALMAAADTLESQKNSVPVKDKSSETFADDRKALMAAADTLESQKNSVPVKDKSSETFADDRKALMAADKKNTNPNVEYKNFKDEAYGFSFDYPIRIGDKQLNEIQQSSVYGNAAGYYTKLSKARVEMGVDIGDNIDDVNRRMSVRNGSFFDDIKTKKISDTEFFVTFIVPSERANGVQKNFFVRDKYDKKIYHYYVRYIYNDKTPADQDAICKHIFESFKPPS